MSRVQESGTSTQGKMQRTAKMRIGMRIVIIVLLSVACVGLCLAAEPKESGDTECAKLLLERGNIVQELSW